MHTEGFTPAPFPKLTGLQEAQIETGFHQPPAAAPKRGKRRGPRPPKPAAGKAAKKAKPAKKPRKSKAALQAQFAAEGKGAAAPISRRPRQPRALKVDLAVAMSALGGLSQDDAKVVHSFVQALAPFSKKARERILGALARIVV